MARPLLPGKPVNRQRGKGMIVKYSIFRLHQAMLARRLKGRFVMHDEFLGVGLDELVDRLLNYIVELGLPSSADYTDLRTQIMECVNDAYNLGLEDDAGGWDGGWDAGYEKGYRDGRDDAMTDCLAD